MRPRLYVPAEPASRLDDWIDLARSALALVFLALCAMAACFACVTGAMSLIVGFGLG